MIDVILMNKSIDFIAKQVKRNKVLTKTIKKPDFSEENSYKNIIDEIVKSFEIKNKKSIILLAFTKDEDEIPIKTQNDLEELGNEIQYFILYLETNNYNFDEDDIDFNLQIDINMEIKDNDILNNFSKQKNEKFSKFFNKYITKQHKGFK